jgi:predicted deacylase
MQFVREKKPIIVAFCVATILGYLFFGFQSGYFTKGSEEKVETPVATSTAVVATSTQEIVGYSVEGRPIELYTYGTGAKHVLFVGGMHGGYEWNSVALAYEAIAYFATADTVPEQVTVGVIPNLNPDGLALVSDGQIPMLTTVTPNYDTGLGRFNANDVDLNRNFDCKWQPESSWRGQPVAAGSAPFSEPEAVALREVVASFAPEAVVFWHSRANNVYASECEAGVLPQTTRLMNAYAQAAGYGAVNTFDAYEVTGDAEGWLASLGIPAITVELGTRDKTEWDKNKAGIEALFSSISHN